MGLPDSLCQLTVLQELYFGGNKITSLPDSLGQLPGLRVLDLHLNEIKSHNVSDAYDPLADGQFPPGPIGNAPSPEGQRLRHCFSFAAIHATTHPSARRTVYSTTILLQPRAAETLCLSFVANYATP
jgi:Leucine-rich repeat (LRR) protein